MAPCWPLVGLALANPKLVSVGRKLVKLDRWGTFVSPWGLTRHPHGWPRPGVGLGECWPSVGPVDSYLAQWCWPSGFLFGPIIGPGFDQRLFSAESCFSKLVTRVRRTTRFAVFLFPCWPSVGPDLAEWIFIWPSEPNKNLPNFRKSCLLRKTCTPKLPLFFIWPSSFAGPNALGQHD